MTLAKTMSLCLLTRTSQREKHTQLKTLLSRLMTFLTLKSRAQKNFLRSRVHPSQRTHQSSLISSISSLTPSLEAFSRNVITGWRK